MVECDWAILCDYAFLDVQRKMCMIGVFDNVFAPAVPSTLHQSSLAVKLLGQPNETVSFKVEIIRPTGGSLAAFEGTVQVGERGAAEIQVNIAGLPLPDYGLYSFNVYVGTDLLKTAGFVVMRPPQTPPAQVQPPETGR
ncbi:MAG TPA: hypothetical protein VGR48_02285 [Terriglobales bacterium]|nr:hypothetical protein [Terriglobales bacterium]